MHSLLEGVTAADIRTDPFAHIVIPEALDPALADAFPSFSRIAWGADGPLPNNRRFALSAQAILDASDLPDCWKQFSALHSGPGFLAAVEALFAGHWHPDLLTVLDGHLTGHTTSRLTLQERPGDGGCIRQHGQPVGDGGQPRPRPVPAAGFCPGDRKRPGA